VGRDESAIKAGKRVWFNLPTAWEDGREEFQIGRAENHHFADGMVVRLDRSDGNVFAFALKALCHFLVSQAALFWKRRAVVTLPCGVCAVNPRETDSQAYCGRASILQSAGFRKISHWHSARSVE
jgi:hypothetical protein